MTSDLPPCCLEVDQVDKLKTALSQPLTGRSVLLPLTGQAFRIGRLEPTIVEGQEQVELVPSPNATPITVSLPEAQQWLKAKATAQKAQSAKPATAPKLKSILKEEVKYSEDSKEEELEFIDIQEEYTDDGQQVRGSAVNLSRQLGAIWKNANEPGIEDIEEEPPLQPVTDQDYERLASRLDELARLEEEAAKPNPKLKGGNASSGWGKGFLNSKPKKKEAPKLAPKQEKKAKPLSNDTKKSVVSFGENQVQEIPRVGNTPASSIQQPGTRKMVNAPSTTRPIDSSVFSGVIQERPAERPIGERPVERQIGERPVIAERSAIAERESQQPKAAAAPKKKRVSRFAQERHEYEQ